MAMAIPTQTWTISSLIGAFIDLSLAYLLLCGAALAFAASTFLSLFGLSLPLPIDGLFGRPIATISSVHSSLRSRSPVASILCPDSPQFTEETSGLRQRLYRKGSVQGNPLTPPAELSGSVYGAEDAGLRGSDRTQSLGNEGMLIRDLEQALEVEQAARAALYLDLEKERSAAATAADEAMAMILRLQEEKAAVKMEARQYRRMVEEKSLYDAEEMGILKEIVLRREMDKHFLEKELEGYRLHGGNWKEEMAIGIQHMEEKLLEDDPQLRGSDGESEDPVLVLHEIYESLGKMKSKGIKKGAQVHAAVDFGEELLSKGTAEGTISPNGDIKQAYRLDKSDSGCESPLEFQEKGVLKVDVSPSSEQRQGTSYGESSHKAASVLQDDAKDAGEKVSDSSQFEAELRVLDVYAIDDRLKLADGGSDKDADLSQMRCGNGIYGKEGPVVESAGTSMIGLTYINPVSDSGSVEQNVSRSSSDMTSVPRLMDTLCHKPSPFNLRRSSMSAINNERSRLEIEVELLRKRLESVQQGRERLSLTREHKEDESFQLHLLQEMACQLQEMRKTTEPERNVHQALLPPLSSKVVSKKRSSHSVSWGLQDST